MSNFVHCNVHADTKASAAALALFRAAPSAAATLDSYRVGSHARAVEPRTRSSVTTALSSMKPSKYSLGTVVDHVSYALVKSDA